MIVIADIDLSESAEPTWQALRELELTSYNGIIGLGDLSYSIDDENGLRGDNFFNVFAEFSTKVPVLLIAGNHEKYDHFRLFNYRFRMPQYNPDWDNNVYTVLENNALFLFVNFDFILKGPIELYKQTLLYTQSLLEQLKDDRRVRWRVFSSHRTLSCGRIEHYSCRTNLIFFKPFDDLLRKHTFDLYLAAHDHLYERVNFVDELMNLVPVKSVSGENHHLQTFSWPAQPLSVVYGMSGSLPEQLETNRVESPLTAALVSQVPGYLDLRLDNDTLELRFMSSVGRNLVDGVRITKTTPFDNRSRYPTKFLSLLSITTLLLLGLLQFLQKVPKH